MKKKILSIFLFCFIAFAIGGVVGCGQVSLSTIQTNFDSLNEIYSSNSTIFISGDCDGLQTKYLISYGSALDNEVSANTDGYYQLKTIYNSMFAIASEYIDANKEIVSRLEDGSLSKEQKSALNTLNKNLTSYKESVTNFISDRESYIHWFDKFSASADEDSKNSHLRNFKKSYGEMVDKNLELALSMANLVDASDIFSILQKTEPVKTDSIIIKNYLKTKLLSIYSKCFINEIENNINWDSTPSTETKTKIDNLLNALKNSFIDYKNDFILKSDDETKTLTKVQISKILPMIDDFFVEADNYYQALKGLDIKTLSNLTYRNDLEKYKEKNSLAEVYLNKLDEFIKVTLPEFISNISEVLFG